MAKKIQVLTMMSGTWFLSAFWMKTVISKLAHVCAPLCLLTMRVCGICVLSSALSSKGLWQRPISSTRCSGNARRQCGLREDGKMDAPLECLGLCAVFWQPPQAVLFPSGPPYRPLEQGHGPTVHPPHTILRKQNWPLHVGGTSHF